ncbi:efflux RND transporter periplasmic adaptor subunit [Geoalkalibacter halelectricus]|uniref:Efflux RND transporter periplasmic adaptor subunit n=1 Tax=Geoalkalibacter halelectricus TaxID=2847045 RepID=A0ABY5ZJ93_9BACT|nr:efflux RND transporter periplasmic adaptor subunit [Geoalkalibacter halelectricus]MDO3377327.1 efflux RND transporter periplasmic adaptor subunit [Geoalkalibacter halelectricus]UWZ79198.1 efflux RND transporter periplasmic adaptor subunit [Geoalkalibacter halelectricus]
MPMSHSRRPLRRLILILAASYLLAGCGGDSEQQAGQDWAPPVTVMSAEKTSVQVEQTYAGRLRGAREVEVRTRVQGILEERLYQEGGYVAQGEALFRIDPEPFAVALQAARAEEQSAQADLQQAEREWERISRLYEQDAVSRRERDQALSALELAQARRALTRARTAQAQLEMGYTRVEAPLSGVTSLEVLPEGSLVERGTLLTTIVEQDPIHVRFSLPEDDAAIQRSARAALAGAGAAAHSRKAQLVLPDGSLYERSGEIDFTAATIDPRTGTVSARAVFSNPDRLLVPGQFLRVRVLLQTLDDVALVPESAVVSGPEGPSLYLLDEDDKVHLRPISLGPVVDGGQVVLEGLEEGGRLVVNGQAGLRPGMAVNPQDAESQESR